MLLTLASPSYLLPGSAPLARSQRSDAVVMGPAVKKVAVGVIGTGLVGSEVLKQVDATSADLAKQGLQLHVAAISTRRDWTDSGERKPWMLCQDDEGCSIEGILADLNNPDLGEEGDFMKMADHLKSVSPHAILVDATASEVVSDFYPKWLAKGVHVVTPNKKAGSGDLARWKECISAMEATGAQWGDETTVGAGLPILNTLRTDLLATGDKVKTSELPPPRPNPARPAHGSGVAASPRRS